MKKIKLLQLHKSIYEITAQHTIVIFSQLDYNY